MVKNDTTPCRLKIDQLRCGVSFPQCEKARNSLKFYSFLRQFRFATLYLKHEVIAKITELQKLS